MYQAAARSFWDHACFLAQQTVGKALNAFWVSHGAWDLRGHSVADLCSQAANLDKPFAELVETVAPLDKFYIPTRYPNGLPGGTPSKAFDRDDAEKALDTAQRAMTFIADRLDPARYDRPEPPSPHPPVRPKQGVQDPPSLTDLSTGASIVPWNSVRAFAWPASERA